MPRNLRPVDYERAFHDMQAAGEKVKLLAAVVQNWNGGTFTDAEKAEYSRQFAEADSAFRTAHTQIFDMLYNY